MPALLNELPEVAPTPSWKRFLRQFHSPMIYVLLFALAFDAGAWIWRGASGVPVEALAIAGILLLNAGLGAFQEHRSEKAIAELKALSAPLAWVLRAGELTRIPSREIVPGDVVRVEAGERIPADGRVVEGRGVLADESLLTGESLPVEKAIGDELQSGTMIVRGRAFFEVTRIGAASSMGRLASLLGRMEIEKTPLEKRLAGLGRLIARVVGGLAVLLAVAGLAVEGLSHFEEVIFFAVALAVAAVPEGMPAVVTLTLALGVQRMAKRNAVVRRLSAVEALGSVTVIATDKTGTLTENRMTVSAVNAIDETEALLAMVLANDADATSRAGDPIDLGLLDHAASVGLDATALRLTYRPVSSRPFDSAWKFMRTTVDDGRGPKSYLKGAPETILARCSLGEEEKQTWAARADSAASSGHRVLALASAAGEAEDGLSFLGLVLLWDPPRKEVPDAIRRAQEAGLRVLMITGDHAGTAAAVARAIGMTSVEVRTGAELDRMSPEELNDAAKKASVFARVSPEHKLALVSALKAGGEIVAMTGDGVNDAPALKRSDVGIAMGTRGSDVTREVADLVLLDDNFASIVSAIEEGRGIYENIQSFIRFTFSSNVALVLLIVSGAIGSWMLDLRDAAGMLLLPLTALQLLWVNFLGDGPPALALALDRNPDVMRRPPRPANSALLDAASLRFILLTGGFKGALGIALLIVSPLAGLSLLAIQTAIFLYESIAKLVSAYPARRVAAHPAVNWVLLACVLLGVALQLLTIAVPGLRDLLGLETLAWIDLVSLTIIVAATWVVTELVARFAGGASPIRSAAL